MGMGDVGRLVRTSYLNRAMGVGFGDIGRPIIGAPMDP